MGIQVYFPVTVDGPIVAVPHTLTKAELDAMDSRRRANRLSKSRINKARRELGLGPIEALKPGVTQYTPRAR